MLRIQGSIIEMDLLTLKGLIADAIKIAAKEETPYITKSEAYRMYGRGVVDNWIRRGLVKQYKDTNSSKIRISRQEIGIVASANNRLLK